MTETITPSRTPDLAELLQLAVDQAVDDLFVALPGKVEKYNPTTQTATVKPLLKRPVVFEDGSEGEDVLQPIPDVPVAFPRGGGFFLTFPLQPGDNVLLVFCDRSIDLYSKSSGAVDVNPIDLRSHDISDAVAIPGFYPALRALEDAGSTDMVIGKDRGGIQIKFTPTGEMKVTFAGESPFSAVLAEALQNFWDAALIGFQALIQKHVHLSAAPTTPTGPSIDPITLSAINYPAFPTSAISSKVKLPG